MLPSAHDREHEYEPLIPSGLLEIGTRVDTLVIGGGVAGFSAAIAAARHGSVLLVTKEGVGDSNTGWAQGGVAVVLGEDDSLEAHVEDTIATGQGLCERETVRAVVEEGPARVRELLDWGGDFDKEGGSLHLTREGGHTHHRIIHAAGDATGREFVRTLWAQVRDAEQITTWDFSTAVRLLVEDGRCVGAVVLRDRQTPVVVGARATILATGGAGRVWRETTNPSIATGDGVAIAARAGAIVADLEFMQFHPTTLYVAGAARHLITEAVRGEGGYLVDFKGERFVFRYHPDGELAPRDVVSRAIVQHLAHTDDQAAFLDLRHLGAGVRKRFPGLDRTCKLYNLDITRDLIPVHPSAHYLIGGVLVDASGRTTVPGLFAAGEVAMSGLHGANRLASNSLLEGLVLGQRTGSLAGQTEASVPTRVHVEDRKRPLPASILNVPDMINSLASLMWRRVGILRDGDGLRGAVERLETWRAYVEQVDFQDVAGFEMENMLTVATLVARGASWREESRGTHHRSDCPEKNDEQYLVHSLQLPGGDIIGRPVG